METTPIHPLTRDVNGNRVFMKRDDLFPFSFGGNKYRKALLYFEDLKEKGCDHVVTTGGGSSNHCRIVANMAAREGIGCSVVLSKKSPDAHNKQLMKLLGADVRTVGKEAIRPAIDETLESLRADGRRPYFIANGGHGYLGTKAFADAYLEIVRQEADAPFDYLFFASGTGTTHAGLAAGERLLNHAPRTVGISVVHPDEKGRALVAESANEYLREQGATAVREKSLLFSDAYLKGGYGEYDEEILETIREVFNADGVPLDPVYTGKAFYGMSRFLEEKGISGRRILFLHTGGAPIFFDVVHAL